MAQIQPLWGHPKIPVPRGLGDGYFRVSSGGWYLSHPAYTTREEKLESMRIIIYITISCSCSIILVHVQFLVYVQQSLWKYSMALSNDNQLDTLNSLYLLSLFLADWCLRGGWWRILLPRWKWRRRRKCRELGSKQGSRLLWQTCTGRKQGLVFVWRGRRYWTSFLSS